MFWSRFELTTSVVIVTDCIGSCKSIYNTITARTAPPIILYIFYVLYIYRQYQLYTLCLVKSDILVLRKFYGKTFLHFSVQTTKITIIVCRLNMRRHMNIYVKNMLKLHQVYIYILQRSTWLWSYGSWIYNYLCNQCLSPLMSVWISIRARYTTLFDKVCQWLTTGRWFSPDPPVPSTNKADRHDITEIFLC